MKIVVVGATGMVGKVMLEILQDCSIPISELLVVAFAQNTPGGGSVHALPMAKEILKVWNKNN